MRRVLHFFDSEEVRWKKLAISVDQDHDISVALEVQEGRRAYAYRQASIRKAMREHCAHKWCVVPDKIDLTGNFKDGKTGFIEFR